MFQAIILVRPADNSWTTYSRYPAPLPGHGLVHIGSLEIKTELWVKIGPFMLPSIWQIGFQLLLHRSNSFHLFPMTTRYNLLLNFCLPLFLHCLVFDVSPLLLSIKNHYICFTHPWVLFVHSPWWLSDVSWREIRQTQWHCHNTLENKWRSIHNWYSFALQVVRRFISYSAAPHAQQSFWSRLQVRSHVHTDRRRPAQRLFFCKVFNFHIAYELPQFFRCPFWWFVPIRNSRNEVHRPNETALNSTDPSLFWYQ